MQAGAVLVPAGSLVATIAVPVLGDLVDEPDEAFNVQLGVIRSRMHRPGSEAILNGRPQILVKTR